MGQRVQAGSEPSYRGAWRVHGLVLAAYTVLSLALTYPLIRNLRTYFPGDGGDGYFFVWNFWFFKEQVLHLHNPFFTDAWFYPVGTSLFFTSFTVINDVLAMMLYFVTSNIVVASNLTFLLSLLLSGYFTFLLVDYLTDNKPAAFLAGVIFAFCPYHLIRFLGHFDLTLTHWIPLFVLFFLKMADPKGTYRHAIIAGIIAALTLLDVYYYTIFLIFFVALFYLYKLTKPAERWDYLGWRGIKKALVLTTTSALLAGPFLALAYQHAHAGFYGQTDGWMGANELGSDITAFFVPSFRHPLWKEVVWNYYFERLHSISVIESLVFIGWLVTIISVFASVYLARRRSELRLWRFLFIAFVLLSLGPTLHVMGKYVFDFDGLSISIPLPYLLVHYIPLLNNVRAPSRLAIMFMFCAAVLCAYTWVWIQEKMRLHPRARVAVFALLTLGILFEYLNVPPLCTAKLPVVFQKIAQDPNPGTILELPVGISDAIAGRGNNKFVSFWTYAQIVHHKKRIGGHTGRGVKKALDYFEHFPVLHNLLDLLEDEKGERAIAPEEVEENRKTVADLIKQLSLRYIVVHPDFRDSAAHRYIAQVFNLDRPTYEEEGYLVYRINEPTD
jgi:hypothetical protein